MTRYPIPAERTQTEIEVKKSRFIATAGPVFSIEEARAFIKAVKVEFADASH
ncbi:MAG: putative IMPACT (imprinted ancient) family translation regulator, partial [Candidatus Promineifilaceae bacterium]